MILKLVLSTFRNTNKLVGVRAEGVVAAARSEEGLEVQTEEEMFVRMTINETTFVEHQNLATKKPTEGCNEVSNSKMMGA